MQEEILVNLSSNKRLHVVANLVGGTSAVVIVHGLGGYVHESLYEDARRYFNKRGINVYRPKLYSWEDDARNLVDCTLKIHSNDLDELITYLHKSGTESIYMVGHSFGCPVILGMSQHIDGAILWDGTYTGVKLSFLDGLKRLENRISVLTAGAGLILGSKMIDEVRHLSESGGVRIVCNAPTKLIYAGDGILHLHLIKQRNSIREAGIICSTEVIEGADHNFTGDNVKDKLYRSTYNWIVQHK